MLLGISPLALHDKPPQFLPWKDAACLAFFWAAATQTRVAGSGSPSATRTTVVPSLRNPVDTLTVPVSFQGPKLDTSIGSQPTWVADTLLTTLGNATVAIPAINATGASVFEWFIGRFDASASGFNTLLCLGSGSDPAITAVGASAGISAQIGGIKRTVASGAGYADGTAKRIIAYRSGTDVLDYLQWGSVSSGTGGTSTTLPITGVTFFNRGNNSAPSVGALSAYGLFTATGANAAARTLAATDKIAKLDAWALGVYGSTAWSALIS